MLSPDEERSLTRRLKRSPIVAPEAGVAVDHDRAAIERLVPHRSAMLLLDRLDRIDLAGGAVRGTRRLDAADPGFDGHFPGEPVYPGVLVVEAMGQLGLTLLHFVRAQTTAVPPAAGDTTRCSVPGITGAGPQAAGEAAAAAAVAPAGAVLGRVRAVHVHHATFIAPFVPGDTMTLHAQVIAQDAFTLIAAGQAWNGGTLAAFAISEVFIDE